MPSGYTYNQKPHGDILAWIVSVGMWVIIGQYAGLVPPERKRGTYVTKPHDVACANYIPAHRPRKNEDAQRAQQEVREDPELAAEVERLWRDKHMPGKSLKSRIIVTE